MPNQNIQIVYPGCKAILFFSDLLETLEHVVEQGKQQNFMIKPSSSEQWKDGAEMLKQFQKLFETA